MGARARLIANIEEMAARSFKDHVITEELRQGVFRSFHCGRPRDCSYSFRIATIPGSLIVTGDLGVLIVQRVRDMFAWAPGAIDSLEYFAEKVPSEIQTRQYDSDVAREYLAEQQTAEGTESKRAETASDLERYVDDGEQMFKQQLYDSGLEDGCDFPDLDNWKPSFLWCREAIRWFFRHATQEQLMVVVVESATV